MAWNEQVQNFLNAAGDQAKGKNVISQQMYDDVVHEAGDWTWGEKEQFLGELSAQYVDTMYTDASWVDKYGDIFFMNSEQFGAVVQIINTEMPEIRENRAWDTITSGVTTIGSNTVYLPVVKEQLTGGTSSWAVPYAFTGTQLDAAFKNAAGLRRFETFIVMAAENAAKYHLARMTATNRNNYIAQKLHAGNSYGVNSKINVVNLVDEYCQQVGRSSMTASQFLANTDGCLRSVYKTFKKYKAFLTDLTTLFTMDATSTGKFIPADRFTFSIISDFAALLETEVYSTTYHENFVKLTGYREVPAWQGLVSATTTLSFADMTTINGGREDSVINDGFEINQSGVVGLMCDKWAIMHTVVKHRTGVQRDDIKDITLFEHQYTDRYINNLMLNGVVFVVQDSATR